VHFLQASRPYRPLGANAMLFFDPGVQGLFGGGFAGATEILADDAGIEQLIARLEELDEDVTWTRKPELPAVAAERRWVRCPVRASLTACGPARFGAPGRLPSLARPRRTQ
jgi:hypothetical protein